MSEYKTMCPVYKSEPNPYNGKEEVEKPVEEPVVDPVVEEVDEDE